MKSIDVPSNIKNLSNGSSYNFSGSCNASHKLYTNYLIRGAYDYSIVIKNNLGKYDLKVIEEVLLKHGFNLNTRAEEIPLEVFVELANNLN